MISWNQSKGVKNHSRESPSKSKIIIDFLSKSYYKISLHLHPYAIQPFLYTFVYAHPLDTHLVFVVLNEKDNYLQVSSLQNKNMLCFQVGFSSTLCTERTVFMVFYWESEKLRYQRQPVMMTTLWKEQSKWIVMVP